MNATIIDREICMQTLEESEILTTIPGPSSSEIHIATRYGVDIFIMTDLVTGGAVVIEPCSEDRITGGSIHDHARASLLAL